jgi:outer membrane protein OmpA-like peptidoglycan-associated protein
MIGKVQKPRAVNKTPVASVGGTREKPKTLVGHGNHNRANALQPPRILQTKLTIGKTNDPFEHEADRVANEVMRTPNKTDSGSLHPISDHVVQRQCACGGGCDKCKKKQLSLKRATASSREAREIPSSVHEVLRSPGRALDANTRAFMEPRFGYDFSQVRVHNDAAAARSTMDVNALAFTVGNHIAFAAGQYVGGSSTANRLLAHELAHVVQQAGAVRRKTDDAAKTSLQGAELPRQRISNVVQRAGDPSAVPLGFACPTDLVPSRPAGTDVLFTTGDSTITPAHTIQLTAFVAAWVAAGGTDDILVHGFASTPGDQDLNWTLSCNRAQAVQGELIRLGVPAVHIDIVAHGESTDFGASAAANQHAVVSTSGAGLFSNPFIFTVLNPRDPFAGRSNSRFGVGEIVDLDFFSIPPRPAADFGGLRWAIASGGGALSAVTNTGTATYTAPGRADTVTLELRIAAGATAGTVAATRVITIVEPSGVRMTRIGTGVPSFASFTPPTTIPVGSWGAGFTANVFVDPRDVSFRGVEFGEGTVASVITGTFFAPFAGIHGVNTFGLAPGGNSVTGTLLGLPDGIFSGSRGPVATVLGASVCGTSDFLWAIPWEFRVPGGARTRFPRGFTANHHATSSIGCQARIEKGGAGPFCRRINGTAC